MKKTVSPFSPRNERRGNVQVSVACASPNRWIDGRLDRNPSLVGDSLWLSKKMVDNGCSLQQTLHVMEEKCKDCTVVSPMVCVEQCETWNMKKELREMRTALSNHNHGHEVLNAVKNGRRQAILDILWEGALSPEGLQTKLRNRGFNHSQKVIYEYLKPLLKVCLVKRSGKRFILTLYGRKIHGAMVRHRFADQLPANSSGHEERILRALLSGAKTRQELHSVTSSKTLSRTLKRLRDCRLISNSQLLERVFYFRTKRALHLERLSPTQKRVCDGISLDGISAKALSKTVGINLRRTYKYLRSLRGKKLVFKRVQPRKIELTASGRKVAEFLEEIEGILNGTT